MIFISEVKMALRLGLKIKRLAAAALFCSAACFAVGCCKKAPEGPQYYERELQAMKKAELLKQKEEAERPTLKDGYPWQGKKRKNEMCLPCRLKHGDYRLQAEIDCLNECVHGKKKTRVKFRD